jgi:hypothetical protein
MAPASAPKKSKQHFPQSFYVGSGDWHLFSSTYQVESEPLRIAPGASDVVWVYEIGAVTTDDVPPGELLLQAGEGSPDGFLAESALVEKNTAHVILTGFAKENRTWVDRKPSLTKFYEPVVRVSKARSGGSQLELACRSLMVPLRPHLYGHAAEGNWKQTDEDGGDRDIGQDERRKGGPVYGEVVK